MTTDHKATAESANRQAMMTRGEKSRRWHRKAQVHASLAIAEQQRIANLTALGAIGGGPINQYPGEMSAEYLRDQYPEIAASLGIGDSHE